MNVFRIGICLGFPGSSAGKESACNVEDLGLTPGSGNSPGDEQTTNSTTLGFLGFPGGSDSKASACNTGDPVFNPWAGKIPWRRKWQPTPVFLPGKSHGQRTLAGYSLPGHTELNMTEAISHSTAQNYRTLPLAPHLTTTLLMTYL